jgi:hypothetical protein
MKLNFGRNEQEKKMIWVSAYVMDKEYFVPEHIQKCLNFLNNLMYKKKVAFKLALSITNKFFEELNGISIGEDTIQHFYNARKAHINNGIKKYAEWSCSRREQAIPQQKDVRLCACGCGAIVKKGNKYIVGHNNNHMMGIDQTASYINSEVVLRRAGIKRLCACGCGEYVTHPKNKYIRGHNARCVDKKVLIEKAENMRKRRNEIRTDSKQIAVGS